MKTTKKLLAILLSALMVFSMATSSAFAVEETKPAETLEIEDIGATVTSTLEAVIGFVDSVHNLVGDIMALLDKECALCGEIHDVTVDAEDLEKPEEPVDPETPEEPEVPEDSETPEEPEDPTEPEKPESDKPSEDQVADAFGKIESLIDSIHNLVGGILAVVGRDCPLCDEDHIVVEKEEADESVETEEEIDESVETDVIL